MEKPWYYIFYIKSPIVKILLGIVGVFIAVAALLFIGIFEENRMAAQTENWNGRSIEKGAELFANNCATCHGLDGRGGAGPALHSRYFFTQRLEDVGFSGSLEDYIKLTVAAGRPSKSASGQWSVVMATWGAEYGGPLRNDQVQHVTNYVLNWEESALAQTEEEDPWIPFQDTPSQAEISTGDQAAVGAVGEGEAIAREPAVIFQELGCLGCHVLDQPQTAGSRGAIGPNMGNLAENAATRVEGLSAEEYVRQSILQPNAHVVESYQANIMPQGLADRMTEEEFDNLVAWLLDPNRGQ